MVSLVLPRLLGLADVPRRAVAVTGRNVAALRSAYWLVVLSGFLEPVLYLFSIGVGVGALVGDITLPGGQVTGYAAFVAPAMLAAAAMNGALNETTYNFFGKMAYMKLYEGVVATPVRPFEIALGELMWAMIRGTLYSAAFLAIMVAMGLTSAGRAVAAFPVAVLTGLAFGAFGIAMSTFLRSWQDFDLVASVQFTLFLFSGTFVPAESYPAALRWLVEVTPLYRAVELTRGITVGGPGGWALLMDVLYLAALATVGLLVAANRMGRRLHR